MDDQVSLKSVALGVVVDFGGSILTIEAFCMSAAVLCGILGLALRPVLIGGSLIIGLAGAFCGAFLAAHLAPGRRLLHALLVGVADVAASVVFASPGMGLLFLGAYLAAVFPAILAAGKAAEWIEHAQLEEGESAVRPLLSE